MLRAALVVAVVTLVGAVVGAQAESFQNAKLNVQDGEKTKQVDAVLQFDTGEVHVLDKKTKKPIKTFPYASVKGAEYSYAKSPRWKTAIFVSPLFLFTSGKKHWFMMQGEKDYALVQLDKSNYRLVLGAFEARSGIKVETVEDSK